MPLPYIPTVELNIPDSAFKDDVADLLVTGSSHGGDYGGVWSLRAIPYIDGTSTQQVVGAIVTDPAPGEPDLAVDTAYIWVATTCIERGWKITSWDNKNRWYGRDEAPYVATARFCIDRSK